MQVKTLLPAALAWSASAMLIPPSTDSSAAIASSSEFGTTVAEVLLPCAGCDVAQDRLPGTGIRAWDVTGDKNTDILLRFGISDDLDHVLLNGQAFYPVDPSTPFAPVAYQVAHPEGSVSVTSDPLPLSARIDVGEPLVFKTGVSSRNVSIEVLGLEDRVVHVGTVVVNVVTDASGEMIISIPEVVPTVTTLRDALCETVTCRVRAQIADKVAMLAAAAQKVKNGCLRLMGMHQGHGQHGHKGGMGMKHLDQDDAKPLDGPLGHLRGGPKKYGHGGPGGKKPCAGGAMGKLAHWFGIFVRLVLLPAMIGIAVGMAVSAIGMILGQLFFMISSRIRGEPQGYVAVYQVEVDEDVEAAEDLLDAEQLPKYEAGEHVLPPAYTDEKEEQS